MKEYDVIVVGAGPAGCGAARAAAEKGAKTILLEEHPQVGLPQHCTGRLAGTKSGIGEEILRSMDRRVIVGEEAKVRRIFSPRGNMIEYSLEGKGVYIIDRGLFDMQLAIQAIDAGAELLVNTKVTGLLTHEGSVVGITTSSSATPEIRGRVVIGADGLRSILSGVPKWAGLAETGVEVRSVITWWLAGVRDVEPGVLELHLGAFGSQKGWIWLAPHDSSTCVADFSSFEDLEQCRRGDSVLSKKIRDAVPVRITGSAIPSTIGKPVARKVKSGLILAGVGAGYHPFLTCLLSGRYAGETAAEAVKDNNVMEERLATYNILCEKLLDTKLATRKIKVELLMGRSEKEMEEFFEKMTRMDDVDFDMLPV